MNPLLLADASPALRLQTLRDLGDLDESDAELRGLRRLLATSPEVLSALHALVRAADFRQAAYQLCRLAYLGYDGPEMAEAAERIFADQSADGSWPLWFEAAAAPTPRRRRKTPPVRPRAEGYRMQTIQTALPLRGVAAAGYATDPRAERAYDWLLEYRLEDGAWPGDLKADLTEPGAGRLERTPGYRRLPRSLGGCRAATTGALACFALHPDRSRHGPAYDALDHLLARDTHDEWSLGFELARLLSFERPGGRLTFYATFDLVFVLDLAARCGASLADARVAALVNFLEGLRGPFGLWEHPSHPQLSRWLTLEIERSLRRLEGGTWVGSEEQVAMTPYPKRRARY